MAAVALFQGRRVGAGCAQPRFCRRPHNAANTTNNATKSTQYKQHNKHAKQHKQHNKTPPQQQKQQNATITTGHDTTSIALTQLFGHLPDHPAVMAKLRAEQEALVAKHGPGVTTALVKEMSYAEAVIR